jgi:hypothetical protein
MEHLEVKEFPPFFTGDTPPAWAVKFCEIDYENLRQFQVRFLGVDEKLCLPLAADKLVGQALELAKSYPDEHHCRASLWLSTFDALTAEQRLSIQFSRFPAASPEPADHPIPTAV